MIFRTDSWKPWLVHPKRSLFNFVALNYLVTQLSPIKVVKFSKNFQKISNTLENTYVFFYICFITSPIGDREEQASSNPWALELKKDAKTPT